MSNIDGNHKLVENGTYENDNGFLKLVKPIENISDFVLRIRQAADILECDFPWFRGEPESDTPLTPSAYRRDYDQSKEKDAFVKSELDTVTMLKPSHIVIDEVVRYAVMQHYGFATRLLDWSSSALASLYFSLESDRDPVVWVIHPGRLNGLSNLNNKVGHGNFMNPDEFVYAATSNDEHFRSYFPPEGPTKEFPIAFSPHRFDERMKAQQSQFTIHGTDKSSIILNTTRNWANTVHTTVIKLLIKPSDKQHWLKDLKRLGIDGAILYPGLDSFFRSLPGVHTRFYKDRK